MTDDQGYGDLSAHGNPILKTPKLDQLASQSIRLTDFHVAPMCTPTRGQLMSGRHAMANGAMNVGSGRAILRKTIPTMANLPGLAPHALFGKWHPGQLPVPPQDRGFEEIPDLPSSHVLGAGLLE
jgi:arylsulfatase